MPEEAKTYKDYFIHDENFLQQRAEKLEEWLKIVSTHDNMRYETYLHNFLTSGEFVSNGSQYLKKFQGAVLKILPNINDRDSAEAYVYMIAQSKSSLLPE